MLILWACFCFLVWDMDMFLEFFNTDAKEWSKGLFIWRVWLSTWLIFILCLFGWEFVE